MHQITVGHSVYGLFTMLALAGCGTPADRAERVAGSASAERVVLSDGAYCQDLLAGQTTDAGDVCVSVDGADLLVTFSTSDGWELEEAHLWAGLNLAEMPQTRTGAPKIGNLPYATGDVTGSTSESFRVPLTTFGLTGDETACDPLAFYIAAHAALRKSNGDGTWQTETGWGSGTRFVSKGTWATYFSGELSCEGDVVDPKETVCETAFAYGADDATCFLDIADEGFNRWGWTNGPLAEGSYTFDVYAGAGQCDTTKGALVGTLSVAYADGVASVSYDVTPGGEWYWQESHLYVGAEPLARDVNGEYTVAPGQYPDIHGVDETDPTNDTYVVGGLSGDIYVVAHAVSCYDI